MCERDFSHIIRIFMSLDIRAYLLGSSGLPLWESCHWLLVGDVNSQERFSPTNSSSSIVPRVDGAFSALYSHIDSVSRLLELGIRGELLIHRTITVFLLHHALKASGAGTVDLVLMLSLEFLSGVTENLAISILLRLLGDRKAGIKPVLVVLDKRSVAAELVIE